MPAGESGVVLCASCAVLCEEVQGTDELKFATRCAPCLWASLEVLKLHLQVVAE